MIFDPDSKQISFACFDDDDEEVVDERAHYLELVEDARTMMKRIMRTPNENFPSFLLEPVQNTFTDSESKLGVSYIDMGLGKVHVENGAEIMQSINGLRNRYKDYFEYMDALATWQRYYDFVEETYGSFEFFASLVEEGVAALPLRLKPKFKNAKKNRHLLEIDVPISRIDRSQGISDEEFAKICSEIPDQIEIYEDYFEYIETMAEFNKAAEEKLMRDNRVKGFRKTSSVNATSSDTAIMEYLSGGYSTTNRSGIVRDRPLCDDIEAFHEYDGLSEDLKQDAMGLRNRVYTDLNLGVLMSTGQTQDDIEVYTALNAAGFDVGAILDDTTMDKKAVKLIKNSIPGLDTNVSAKKAKKMKKKRKKMEKELYDQMAANESVRGILTKNRIEFNAEDNMISFTAKDLFGNN